MAADIINLNKARKAKAKAEAGQRAVENRIRFGRTKAEKARDTLDSYRLRQAAESHRLTGDDKEK